MKQSLAARGALALHMRSSMLYEKEIVDAGKPWVTWLPQALRPLPREQIHRIQHLFRGRERVVYWVATQLNRLAIRVWNVQFGFLSIVAQVTFLKSPYGELRVGGQPRPDYLYSQLPGQSPCCSPFDSPSCSLSPNLSIPKQ